MRGGYLAPARGLLNGGSDLRRVRRDFGIEAREDFAVRADEKLGEIPTDIAAGLRINRFVGEVLIQRSHIAALDGDLGHHRKGDMVFGGAEGLDFLVGAGFLAAEIVGGDADDDEAAVLVFFIKGFQRGVLRREAAAAGDVDEKDDFAFVVGKRRGLAFDGIEREVIDGFFGGHECRPHESDKQQKFFQRKLLKRYCGERRPCAEEPERWNASTGPWQQPTTKITIREEVINREGAGKRRGEMIGDGERGVIDCAGRHRCDCPAPEDGGERSALRDSHGGDTPHVGAHRFHHCRHLFCAGLRHRIYFSRKERSSEEYFLAGRNIGWFAIGASLFVSNISTEHFIGLAGSGAAVGLAPGHYEWQASLILLLLGWVFVPFYLRSNVFTMPEFLERRLTGVAPPTWRRFPSLRTFSRKFRCTCMRERWFPRACWDGSR